MSEASECLAIPVVYSSTIPFSITSFITTIFQVLKIVSINSPPFDFFNHLDYIHYNPVQHGVVTRPEDYSPSSYPEYFKRGWYEIGWGHIEPEEFNIVGLDPP